MRQPKFSGHQTFSLRYGWMEKGYAFVLGGGSFNKPDAIIDLGVGKNMVSSIEYWARLANIITPEGKVSKFADFLLNEESGCDPYMESDASCKRPLFWASSHRILKNELSDFIIKKHTPISGRSISPKILERDIDCFLRCYYARPGKKDSADGSFECPLQELHLIAPLPSDASSYRLNIGPKHTLPAQVIGYALWDMLYSTGRNSLRLQEALYGEYSPGQVFMIDENSLVDAVLFLHEHTLFGRLFDLTESAGIARIHCGLHNGLDLLNDLYTGGADA